MGFFDFFTGRRAPPEGTPRLDAGSLRAALLALDRDGAPFRVREGLREGADLVAEWRVVDAPWSDLFAQAGVKKVTQVLLRLDDLLGEVRTVDRDWEVEWRAGLPQLSWAAESFRGQTIELAWATGIAFREEDPRDGQVHEYRFQTRELKAPLQEIVAAHGWTWRPVAFGRL
ncbi:hypothetical protein [Rubellimicrobium roseum]|uniref:Uncharacterized protein n=1 Tax=Rubellimicrobium roseum TaxID=687525 RepID=A0A5C4N7P0_9RHOB|nr:hypothetical protein [Rubellimicrobium roseum]TNC64499.1 hypothetical protein FHG71_18420 [Rubellimicrobium roseum]